VPVTRELVADMETPVSAYLKVARGRSFLLESVEGGERWARWSIIGTDARTVFRARGGDLEVEVEGRVTERLPTSDPLAELYRRTIRAPGQREAGPPFWGGAVGYASYDLARLYERLPAFRPDELGAPDLLFVMAETLVIFDHLRHRLHLIAVPRDDLPQAAATDDATGRLDDLERRLRGPLPGVPGARPAQRRTEFTARTERAGFEAGVSRALRHIEAGDIFQVVLSVRQSADLNVHPFAIYRALRLLNPSPYLGYLDLGEVTLVASSPESLVRCEGQIVRTRPIAGTRPRGAGAEEDRRLEAELLADEKERAEHVMLVDLGRNDLGRVCRYGTVAVEELMIVERYSHVMHLVSSVRGLLREDQTPLDALAATMPMGTVSGAPKIRAMQIIEDLEPVRRGPYGGAFGYLSHDGNMDMALTLRTMVITGGQVHVQAGAGIVADSRPAAEYEEVASKARALFAAVRMAEEGLG
jgi:anthranilate synthase component 1